MSLLVIVVRFANDFFDFVGVNTRPGREKSLGNARKNAVQNRPVRKDFASRKNINKAERNADKTENKRDKAVGNTHFFNRLTA